MADAHEEHHHPTPAQYVKIALLLAVLTAIEVALFYIEEGVEAIGTAVTAPALIILAFMKFVIVVGYYMHLRYEKSLLTRFFTVGFVTALILYGVVVLLLATTVL